MSLQVAIEVIYSAIQSLAYSIILYWMIGFQAQIGNFLWFYFFIFMSFTYFTLYGMMTVALTPSYQIAAIMMSFLLSFWNLFSGFLIPRTVCVPNQWSNIFLSTLDGSNKWILACIIEFKKNEYLTQLLNLFTQLESYTLLPLEWYSGKINRNGMFNWRTLNLLWKT